MEKKQPAQVAQSLRIGNPMHLEACKRGCTVTRNRKKYTRKGKNRYDYRKEL